ncbi:MAG: plasmid stabilization protein [Rickettsiales bacterium]|nr:MAG: plasmid stabilization protein [Rickettsiales bacterium]
MTHVILSNIVASISELKTNPMSTVRSAMGKPLAILNRNQPVFYCVPADLYEAMLELIDDVELAQIVTQRASEKEIAVDINDL